MFNRRIEKLRIAATLTHRIYGINSNPATIDNFKNILIVNKIVNHKAIITMNPTMGDLRPKKAGDHNMFRINCPANRVRAFLICR